MKSNCSHLFGKTSESSERRRFIAIRASLKTLLELLLAIEKNIHDKFGWFQILRQVRQLIFCWKVTSTFCAALDEDLRTDLSKFPFQSIKSYFLEFIRDIHLLHTVEMQYALCENREVSLNYLSAVTTIVCFEW